jgi:hypothetical protein
MKVYRIAHLDATLTGVPVGPYHVRNYLDWDIDEALEDWSMGELQWDATPTPEDDGLSHMERDEYSCFRTMGQLLAWFGPALADLADGGFMLLEYELHPADVRHGYSQSVARLRYASDVVAKYVAEIIDFTLESE